MQSVLARAARCKQVRDAMAPRRQPVGDVPAIAAEGLRAHAGFLKNHDQLGGAARAVTDGEDQAALAAF
ncbi:MAG TPA: hypothetical protein VF004_07915 [Burkholderiales bacterium]